MGGQADVMPKDGELHAALRAVNGHVGELRRLIEAGSKIDERNGVSERGGRCRLGEEGGEAEEV
jgi:hypothetical protein